MKITMNDEHIVSITQLNEMLKLTRNISCCRSKDTAGTYSWIGKTLSKFGYNKLRKKDKNIVKTYIKDITGYSDSQIDKLIRKKKIKKTLKPSSRTQNVFKNIYTGNDISILATVSNAYHGQNGHALKKVLREMYTIHKDERFKRLCNISVSHIYNLKKTNIYVSNTLEYTKTQTTKVSIGERRKPEHNNQPGFLRIDSVHQGDLDKKKGVYHINIIDEYTQWEYVGCVSQISEYHLEPLLHELILLFPFKILNFHSDNGSEYINKTVASLLSKLKVTQTKSRSRRTNDNALVEGKNASVVRKIMGRIHIPQGYALQINNFYREHVDEFLNFHRPCAFPTDYVDNKGKIKKKYEIYLTPVEKLLSLENCEQYLRDGVTKKYLKDMQMRKTHLKSAEDLRLAKTKLFNEIFDKK